MSNLHGSIFKIQHDLRPRYFTDVRKTELLFSLLKYGVLFSLLLIVGLILQFQVKKATSLSSQATIIEQQQIEPKS